ncbi:MAG TPA: hypothetical protein VF432_29375 [Thermoanaerobaculia bacterium]
MRRILLGLALRVLIATAISVLVWWLFITPFDRLPLPRSGVLIAVQILNFPVALAGEILHPIRGLQLLFEDYSTWCDFCSAGEAFLQQMRIAIPSYLVLLYIPALLRTIARRDPRSFRRIAVGLLVYAVFTAAYFLVTSDGNRRGDVRVAAMWLLILSAAAALASSKLRPRWKLAAIVALLLAGAWAFPFLMTFVVPKMDEVWPYFVPYLALLTLGVGGTLWLTWAIESGIDSWQRRRLEHGT